MSTSAPSVKRKRPYGQSCLACREKKTSCDGKRPICSGCETTGEECHVPLPQRTLRRFPGSSEPASTTEDVGELTDKIRRLENRQKRLEEALGVSLPSAPPSPGHGGHGSEEHPRDESVEGEGARYRLTVDEGGNVVYHGLTGWTHDTHQIEDVPLAQPVSPGLTNPAFAPFFSALATQKHISVAPELGDALVSCYFSYQVFESIQQSLFLRDMALGGPYFSEFLLMAIYAAATRKIDGLGIEERRVQRELFEKLAKEYLAKEMDGVSKIPTIQGLMLLSSTALAEGSLSHGWNYAGMAFRMILDLGIHLSPHKVAGSARLSPEELVTRDKVYWSAFIWDKSISLALGREPTFPPRLGRDPSTIPDFDDEDDSWSPYYLNPVNRPYSLGNYVYQPKRRVATFKLLAKLCLILHDVIVELYSLESRLSSRQRLGFVIRTRLSMEELWRSVPDTMKHVQGCLAPPPYLFMFQMLYHAAYILLHRPIFDAAEISNASGAVATCIEHSAAANDLAVSFTSTFGERMTYVAVYSSFVAASFDVCLLDTTKAEIQMAALTRLQTWLNLMDSSGSRVPSIVRSVNNIATSLCTAIARHPGLSSSDPGRWILMRHTTHAVNNLPLPDWGLESDAFDFFDLLGSA